MKLWWRIRNLPYTGLLLWPGNDGLRPYERRRDARRYERTIAVMPKRTRAEVERLLATAPRVQTYRDADGKIRIRRDENGRPVTRPADPWGSCLDVDPFTGQPDHQHGDSCPDCPHDSDTPDASS